jgi:structure-specific recognition protein 1
MIFSNAKRAEVKEKNPDIAFGEVGRKLGEMWNALSEAEKKVKNSYKSHLCLMF